jgi:hypothetical protein
MLASTKNFFIQGNLSLSEKSERSWKLPKTQPKEKIYCVNKMTTVFDIPSLTLFFRECLTALEAGQMNFASRVSKSFQPCNLTTIRALFLFRIIFTLIKGLSAPLACLLLTFLRGGKILYERIEYDAWPICHK